MSEFSRSKNIEFGRKGTEGLNKSELYGNPNEFNRYNNSLSESEQMMAEVEEINRILAEIDIPKDSLNLEVANANSGVIDSIENNGQEAHKHREENIKIFSDEVLKMLFS